MLSIKFTVVYFESVNLIGYITVCYLLIVNSYASVHIARNIWTSCNVMKDNKTVLFLRITWHFFFLYNETTGKFILKQLDYSPLFSTSDSQLSCASLIICS